MKIQLYFINFICLLSWVLSIEEKTLTLNLAKVFSMKPPEESEAYFISQDEADKRGLYTIEKNLTNYKNLQWYLTLFIGSQKQEHTFIFDTGSTWLYVPLSDCQNCHTENLHSKGETFSTQNISDMIVYGSGSVSGIIFNDEVRATQEAPGVDLCK